jgi:hypothetical protein
VEEVGPPKDCDPMKASDGPPPKVYKDRSIDEAAGFADAGLKLLLEAEDAAMAVPDKQAHIVAAVQKFHNALAADPYNVKATYNLAAAYARVGRNQCALNLLQRLVEMSTFPSQKEEVQDAANRLFGRGKKWKDQPDPDFDRLRTNEAFRTIVKNF